jgi:hypothetical protein
MQYYRVKITGIVAVGDDEPSPINWAWSPDQLANRLREDMEHINIEFREMILAPKTDDFVVVSTHLSDCKWPDDTCSCQG